MKTQLTLLTVGASVLALCAPALAQVRVEIPLPFPRPHVILPPPEVQVQAPTITFGTPPSLVEIQPGVRVVQDFDQEVFYVDGWYWHPGPAGWWYRTHDYRGGWEPVEVRWVPNQLLGLPRGHYVRYHGPGYWDRDRDRWGRYQWERQRELERQQRAWQWQRERELQRQQAIQREQERRQWQERRARERFERRRQWRQ